jgi:hypothetical protein
LKSGNSSQIGSAVCSPVAYKTEDSWFKLHPYLLSK